MVRGFWNILLHGQWYRAYSLTGKVSDPNERGAVIRAKQILNETPETGKWKAVPFPGPLDRGISLVYTVDRDAKLLRITRWGEDRLPEFLDMDLSVIDTLVDSFPEAEYLPLKSKPVLQTGDQSPLSLHETCPLSIKFKEPTPLNELQQRLFVDFVFIWRFYLDDHSLWSYPSPLFSTFAIAILRLASWDFEASLGDNDVELPVTFRSVPCWKHPETDIFWFHGFLVVLCGNLDDSDSISTAISRGESYLTTYHPTSSPVRTILISLRHVVCVELMKEKVLASGPLPLITNLSALCCSPGFRALGYVLSTSCWKGSRNREERWGVSLPPEIFDMILRSMQPRDLLSFARASSIVERWYYAPGRIPQLPGVEIRTFDTTVPCCGKLGGFGVGTGLFCTSCYTWRHRQCVGLGQGTSSHDGYTCPECSTHPPCPTLTPGGIYQASYERRRRPACHLSVSGEDTTLQQRFGKPTHLRREVSMMGYIAQKMPPAQIDYAILFGGVFCGLAYGLGE